MEGVAQPSGTVTLVFTDVEGSTRLLEALGREAYGEALTEHRSVVREAFGRRGGYEVDYQGDGFFYAFASAPDAVEAVSEAMRLLEPGPIRIRVGLHTGTPRLDPPKYVGLEVHKAARIMAAGHGGQVLLSRATRELLDGSGAVRDLGEHRLKDFERPERLYQLGDRVFPPLKTISNTNLPHPASSFVGREREVAELTALLDSGTRLVTLTGPGGSGKTRLAVEAASELLGAFRGGVFWVELAALREPGLVIPTVSQVVGAHDGLAEHIGERELLLVLDNLEQVLDAAPELAALLERCPGLCLLVTSRERLGIRGEAEIEVLPLPDAEALALFTARSRLEPTTAVEELCRRLDNMPLALELAAARTKALAPEQILERLGGRLGLLTGGRDADPRQRSLEATIAWSYDLLEPEEQQLFARLAVFAGGCTLAAAEEVCDADLDDLASLVEKSLVRRTDTRYWMLETIRDYARARLTGSGERELVARRHADWMLDLAERHDALLMCVRDEEEAALVDAEHENGRAALEYLLETDSVAALRLAAALGVVWDARGRSAEGSALLAAAVAAAPEAPAAVMARAHWRAGDLAFSSGRPGDARAAYEKSLALFESVHDRAGAAVSRSQLGYVSMHQGDLEGAARIATVALEEARATSDPLALWWATCLTANIHQNAGDLLTARDLHLEAIRLARQAGHPTPIGRALAALGAYELLAEDYAAALLTLREQLARISPHDAMQRLNVVTNLGWAALFLDEPGEAHARFAESLRLAQEVQQKRYTAESAFAVAALRVREGATAARLWGAARALLAQCEVAPWALELRVEERRLAPLRERYAVEFELGGTLDLDQTVELALSGPRAGGSGQEGT